MATGRVTAEVVNALQPAERAYCLWDDKLAGFGVKVTPKGGKAYVLQYRMGGRGSKVRRYTIGTDAQFKPLQARAEAERQLIRVRQGVDIADEKKQRQRVAVELAFNKFAPAFCDDTLKIAWPKSWQQAKAALNLHAIPALGDKPLPSITASDLRQLLAKLDKHPATRRNVFAILSYMFNRAVDDGLLSVSPLAGIKAPPQVAERTRTLDDDELRWLWVAAELEAEPYRSIVRHLMLLGQRRSEVAALPWVELSRSRAEWHLPKERAKNGSENVIPLTAAAIARLDALAGGERWPRRGLVFPSAKATAPSGFSKVKRRLDDRMRTAAQKAGGDLAPWKLHDLRRTVATNMQRLRVPFEVIEHLLNHRERTRTGIGKVYQTHSFKDEKLDALLRWEARLAHIVEGSGGVVVQLRA